MIKNTVHSYTFTKEEIENILVQRVAFLTGDRSNENCSGKVNWSIKEGDVGIKDPLDYSPYQPTEVENVTIVIGE